jgi:polysaccharide export outer membrane protein
MTAMEAIATVHGLDGRSANPRGFFILRDESAEVANRVLGRSDLVGPQRMAYLLNFGEAQGLFSARDFIIRDEDTIYMTEAALGSWTRIVAAASAAAVLVRTVQVTSQ